MTKYFNNMLLEHSCCTIFQHSPVEIDQQSQQTYTLIITTICCWTNNFSALSPSRIQKQLITHSTRHLLYHFWSNAHCWYFFKTNESNWLPQICFTYCISHLMLCYFTPSLSFQHSLTCTADLVLERLAQRGSALTTGSELESAEAQDTEEKDAPAKKEECTVHTSSN